MLAQKHPNLALIWHATTKVILNFNVALCCTKILSTKKTTNKSRGIKDFVAFTTDNKLKILEPFKQGMGLSGLPQTGAPVDSSA